MIRITHILLSAALLCCLAFPSLAQEKSDQGAKVPEQKQAKAIVPFYGNTTCPFGGLAIDKKLFAEKGGERIYVCQKACIAKVLETWDESYAKAYPEDKIKEVKNVKCPMMPRKRAKDKYAVTFQGHKLSLCCKKCKRNFKKQPRKWLTLGLDNKLIDFKNANCVAMPSKQVKPDNFVVFEGYVVGICCPKCVSLINKDPRKLAKTLKSGSKNDAKKDKAAPKEKTPAKPKAKI